jgi:hypothetical protein
MVGEVLPILMGARGVQWGVGAGHSVLAEHGATGGGVQVLAQKLHLLCDHRALQLRLCFRVRSPLHLNSYRGHVRIAQYVRIPHSCSKLLTAI